MMRLSKRKGMNNEYLIAFNVLMILMLLIDICCWIRYGGPII